MTKKLTKLVLSTFIGSLRFGSLRTGTLRIRALPVGTSGFGTMRVRSSRIPSVRIGSLLIGSVLIGGLGPAAGQTIETALVATRARQQTEVPVARTMDEGTDRFTFAWSAVEVPATIPFPLPSEVQPEDVTGVALPDAVSVHGFAVEVEARELVLLVSPGRDRDEVTFDQIELLLQEGVTYPYPVGPVRVVAAAAGGVALDFERSVSATGTGLHLGVALHNSGSRDLLLQGVEYWPQIMAPGRRLLVATAKQAETLLALAERSLTPSSPVTEVTPPGAEPSSPSAPVAGFRWLSPGRPVLVPAGHRLVLVWSAESLPEAAGSHPFLLHPVILFARADQPDLVQRLGMPVALRSRH